MRGPLLCLALLVGCDSFAYELAPEKACDPGMSCNVVGQCGCDAGLACDIVGATEPTCRSVTTDGTQGHDCATDEDCAAGFSCRGGPTLFQCRRWCHDDGDCSGAGASCEIPPTPTPPDPALLCSTGCGAADSAGCSAGMGCYFFTDREGRFVTDCIEAGIAGVGDGCIGNADCEPGAACLSTDLCAKLCTDGDRDCSEAPGTTCALFAPTVRIGGVTFGACV